jgi:hypothetical protein
MKKTFQNSILFLLTIIILGIGIGMLTNEVQHEGFTPMLKQFYNPLVRKVRNYTDNKIEHFSNTTRVFLKRFRLM